MPVIIIMIVIMMMMVMVEMLTAGEGFIFKPEAENRLEGGSITPCDHHRRGAIGEGVQSARHALTRRAVNQVAFGDDEDIGGGNLIAEQLIHRGFVIEFRVSLTLGLQCIEISGHHAIGKRGTIHHRDHAIQHDALADIRPGESLNQRLRQGQSRCFNNNVIRGRHLFQQLLHGGQEVIRHRAADTAIGQFDDIIGGTVFHATGCQHFTINTDITKLIDDEGKTAAIGLFNQSPDQRGLASTKKTGDHGCRNTHCRHG